MKGKLTKVTLKKILKYKKYIQTNNPSFFIFNFNNTYLNKCIFNMMKNIKAQLPIYSHILYRLKEITKEVALGDIHFIVLSKNVTNLDIVIWIPILCRLYDVPYVFVENKIKINGLFNSKNLFIFAVKKSIDLFMKDIDIFKKIIFLHNLSEHNNTDLIYY